MRRDVCKEASKRIATSACNTSYACKQQSRNCAECYRIERDSRSPASHSHQLGTAMYAPQVRTGLHELQRKQAARQRKELAAAEDRQTLLVLQRSVEFLARTGKDRQQQSCQQTYPETYANLQ